MPLQPNQQLKIPLHKLITSYILEKKRVHKGELETFVKSIGYEAYTGCRRAQEMTQAGHRNFNPSIKKIYEKGCVIYLWQESTPQMADLAPSRPIERPFTSKFCCIEKFRGQNHNPKCFQLKQVKQINQLTLL